MDFFNLKIGNKYLSLQCTKCDCIKDKAHIICKDVNEYNELLSYFDLLHIPYTTWYANTYYIIAIDKDISLGKTSINLSEHSDEIYSYINDKHRLIRNILQYIQDVLEHFIVYTNKFNRDLPLNDFIRVSDISIENFNATYLTQCRVNSLRKFVSNLIKQQPNFDTTN